MVSLLFFSLLIPMVTSAQGGLANSIDRAVNVSYTAGYEGDEPINPYTLAELIIQLVLGFLGLLFFIIIIVAGYQWLTSGGNEDKISHARDRIKNALIGLVVILFAYILTVFIINQLVNAANNNL